MPRNPLNPKLPPKDPITGRRRRPDPRKTKRKRPGQSEVMKRLWQDPEFKAKMKARNDRRLADQLANPMKYSRAGIPDGMTRAMVKPMWDRAYELADRFIQILKDTGRL